MTHGWWSTSSNSPQPHAGREEAHERGVDVTLVEGVGLRLDAPADRLRHRGAVAEVVVEAGVAVEVLAGGHRVGVALGVVDRPRHVRRLPVMAADHLEDGVAVRGEVAGEPERLAHEPVHQVHVGGGRRPVDRVVRRHDRPRGGPVGRCAGTGPCTRAGRPRRGDLPLRQPRLPGDDRQPRGGGRAARAQHRHAGAGRQPARARRRRRPRRAPRGGRRRRGDRPRALDAGQRPQPRARRRRGRPGARRAGPPRPHPGGDRAPRRGARGGRGARDGRHAGRPRRGPRRGGPHPRPVARTPSRRASRSSRARASGRICAMAPPTQSSPAPRRRHRRRLRRPTGRAEARAPAGRGDAGRSAQLPPLPAARLPGGHGRDLAGRDLLPAAAHLPPPAQRARRPGRGGRLRPRRAPRRPARRRAGHRARARSSTTR